MSNMNRTSNTARNVTVDEIIAISLLVAADRPSLEENEAGFYEDALADVIREMESQGAVVLSVPTG